MSTITDEHGEVLCAMAPLAPDPKVVRAEEDAVLARFARKVIGGGSLDAETRFSQPGQVAIRGSFQAPVTLEDYEILQRVHRDEFRKLFVRVGGVA